MHTHVHTYTYTTISLSVPLLIHLDSFRILAIVNNGEMDVDMQISLWDTDFISK